MKPLLFDLFHQHIGMAFDRQIRLSDLFHERSAGTSWNYSVSSAELALGGSLTYTAPLLGTHAEDNNTWLWAWNNRHVELPLVGKRLASRVKKLADRTGCAMFAAEDVLNCEELFGDELSEHASHVIGVIVSRLLDYDAYYTIPYNGGRGAAVFKEKRLRPPPDQPLIVMCSRFSQLLSAFPVPNHKLAFLGYVADYGMKAIVHGRTVRVEVPRVGELLATFDAKSRLTKLESKTLPTKPAGSKGPPNPRPKQKPRPK